MLVLWFFVKNFLWFFPSTNKKGMYRVALVVILFKQLFSIFLLKICVSMSKKIRKNMNKYCLKIVPYKSKKPKKIAIDTQ